jgi:serine protease Do
MFTSIAIVIGVALISVIIYGAVRWAVAAAPNSPVLTQTTAAPTNAVSAIGDWLKNLVSGNSNGTGSGGTGIGGVGSSGGTIQVVSEESQVIKVVKQDSPAVVSIIASAQVPKMEQCAQSSDMQAVPPEFRQYFQGFSVPSLCQNGTQTERIGAGSGFLVSSDGYIVTNKHVVEDTKAEYTVVLNDEKNFGKKVTAKVVARDPSNDIAVLKIDMTGLPFLSFGDSDQLQVGQTAIAIGYSLGQFDNTVSKGVVSGLSRSIEAGEGRSSETLKGLIQTDAAINPGNSGGPLLDISGNVIGVNVAMADSAQSIGFTLPGNLARNAFEQVKQNGTIAAREQAFFGVRYIAITPELQSTEKLPYNYGMLIGRGDTATDLAVVPGSPADKAGISENDILLEVDGKQLNESYMLSDAVDAHKPGDVLKVKIYHKGQEKTVSVTLEKK